MNQEISTEVETAAEATSALPLPFNQQTYCRYETIEPQIAQARVLVVDNLLRDQGDLSSVARTELGGLVESQLKLDRHIGSMAIENILNNISRLVKEPATKVVHISEIASAVAEFHPDAIVLSGTLRDFDYYQPSILDSFGEFIRSTQTPVLAICGGHQLVGLSFGARVITLDKLEQHEQREHRPQEYQYRFIRITDPDDPIFDRVHSVESDMTQASKK